MPPKIELSTEQITAIGQRIRDDRAWGQTEASNWLADIPMWRRLARGGPNPDRLEKLPWEGAANEHMGITGDAIDELVARAMNTFFGDQKWAPIIPTSGMDLSRIPVLEEFMQWGLQVDIKVWGTIRAAFQEAATVGNSFVFTPWERIMRKTREIRYLPGVIDGVEGLKFKDEDILAAVLGERLRDSAQLDERGYVGEDLPEGPEESHWVVSLREAGRDHIADVWINRKPLDRAGEIEVTVQREEVTKDSPAPRLMPPERVLFADVGDLSKSPFIHLEFDVTPEWYRRQRRAGILNCVSDEDMEKIKKSQPVTKLSTDHRTEDTSELDDQAGITTHGQRIGTRPYGLIFMDYDVDDDGFNEKIVIHYDHRLNIVLGAQFLEELYPSGYEPIAEFKIFQIPNRVRSYGIPQMIADEQLIVNQLINQAIDAQTLRNTPFFFHDNSISGLGDRTKIELQPGIGIGVTGNPAQVVMPMILDTQSVDSLLPLIETMINFMDRRVGRVSFAGGRMNSGGGGATGSPRTFGGVNVVFQDNLVRIETQLKTLAYGGQGSRSGLNELWHQIYAMYAVMMPEELKFQVANGEPRRLTRSDLRHRVSFMFGVNMLSANTAVRRADAAWLYQNVGGTLFQAGAVEEWTELLRRLYQAYGVSNPEQITPKLNGMFGRAPMDQALETEIMVRDMIPLDPHPLDNDDEHIQKMDEFFTEFGSSLPPEQYTELVRHYGLQIRQREQKAQAAASAANTGGRPAGGEGAIPGFPNRAQTA